VVTPPSGATSVRTSGLSDHVDPDFRTEVAEKVGARFGLIVAVVADITCAIVTCPYTDGVIICKRYPRVG
jgi:hypothetical protein